MPRKTMPMRALPEGFALTQTTIDWVSEKYPTVNIDETLERFVEQACAHGWMYADWQAAFRTCVRKGVDNGWNSIVRFKQGRAQDPKWAYVLSDARRYGFREPEWQETPDSYRTQLNRFIGEKERGAAKVLNLSGALKGIA